ncbi:uncharacterized protein LOC124114788 [Haliotis rufescens]|uniref:uncharacterized protein LOC124114788 n=1 Tax=Haliotis rufescens TaxID=6454 RepID=UPI00201F6AF7|nr:uncharacterized protein LOC124114788 [Haliotis rufescens]
MIQFDINGCCENMGPGLCVGILLWISGIRYVYGFIQIGSFQAQTTEGGEFTFMCSVSQASFVRWYREAKLVLGTRPDENNCFADLPKTYGASNNDFEAYISGRYDADCNSTHHRLTLRNISSEDADTVWWCEDYADSASSNVTIDLKIETGSTPLVMTESTAATLSVSVSSTTPTARTSSTPTTPSVYPTTATKPDEPTADNTIYIVVAAAVGAGACVIITILVCWCRYKRKKGKKSDENADTAVDNPVYNALGPMVQDDSNYMTLKPQAESVVNKDINVDIETHTQPGNTPDYMELKPRSESGISADSAYMDLTPERQPRISADNDYMKLQPGTDTDSHYMSFKPKTHP